MDREEELAQQIENEVLQNLDFSREIPDVEVYALIEEAMQKVCCQQHLPLRDKLSLRTEVFHSMRGMDVLTPLLEDDTITEIMVNGYDSIFIERDGQLVKAPLRFRSVEKYHTIVQQIVADSNRVVNESAPIVDARLSDGSRVNVVLSPISLGGTAMTIRKFPKEALTMEKLITLHSLPAEVAGLLELLVKSGYNILISGGTGSGKTTFLNALSEYIPSSQRIITIEDSAELQLHNISNLVRLEVRNANVEGKNAITIRDLIRSSLRMRPDRIIVGEVRGEEALDMLQSLNTGHDGSISTGHANSARDMLSRLETMVLMGFSMPIPALRRQIASALELVIHLGRLRDHSRRVMEITEVLGVEQDEIVCQTWYEFVERREKENVREENLNREEGNRKRGEVMGHLVQKNSLKQVMKLKEAGYYEEFCSRIEEMKGEEYGL